MTTNSKFLFAFHFNTFSISTMKFILRDGSTQQLAGCLRDFRNKPFPVRAKIEYYQNTLTVRVTLLN